MPMKLLAEPMGYLGGQGPLVSSGVLAVKFGDSNDVGQTDVNKADTAFAITTPRGPQFDKFYSQASSEPVTMTHFGPTQLQTYGTNPGAGFEITLGRTLTEDVGLTCFLADMGISGTTIAQWTPGSTYGQASPQIGGGANLFNSLVARTQSFVASTGYSQVVFVGNLGTNDAATSGDANAVAANMTAINNALQSTFPGCKVVWVETHSATVNTFTSTVRTQQESYASMAPSWFKLVNIDYGVLLSDGLHYDANTYLDIGVEVAFAIGDLLGVARRAVSVTPAHVGYGTIAIGSGNVTRAPWMGSQVGDLVYAFVQVAAVGTVTGTPTGWTPANWTLTKSGNTTASGVNVQFAVFERKLDSTDFTTASAGRPARPKAVTFTTPGPESSLKMFTWRGASATNVAQEFVSNTFGTGPISPTGLTTTVDHCAIAYYAGGWAGSTTGENVTITPPGSVASATEIHDAGYAEPDTNAHALSLTAGTLATHGTIAACTMTNNPSMVQTCITVAVAP